MTVVNFYWSDVFAPDTGPTQHNGNVDSLVFKSSIVRE